MPALHDDDLANLAPVDIMVVSFPEPNFHGAIADVLVALIEGDVIRVIDLVLLQKDADGNVEINEIEDLDAASALGDLFDDDHDLLNEDDLIEIAGELAPGSAAAVMVWENVWIARMRDAVAVSGGEIVATNRIPHEVVQMAATANLG